MVAFLFLSENKSRWLFPVRGSDQPVSDEHDDSNTGHRRSNFEKGWIAYDETLNNGQGGYRTYRYRDECMPQNGSQLMMVPVRGEFAVTQLSHNIQDHLQPPYDETLHGATDIDDRSQEALTIYPAAHGIVVVIGGPTGVYPDPGNHIIIKHVGGLWNVEQQTGSNVTYTSYSHLASFSPNLVVGQQVYAGDTKLGIMGDTGTSEGIHLHFKVREGSQAKDAREYVYFGRNYDLDINTTTAMTDEDVLSSSCRS